MTWIYENLTGQRFGHWTVQSSVPWESGKHFSICVCDCGTVKKVADCEQGNLLVVAVDAELENRQSVCYLMPIEQVHDTEVILFY
jgi:hypothetical protein